MHPVDNTRSRSNQIQIVFPLQPFLNDLQMKQSKEAAPESKPKRRGSLRLIRQGCIVQLKLFQRIPKILVFRGIRRINATVNHWLNLFITGKRLFTGMVRFCHRISDPRAGHIFNTCRDIADHSGIQLIAGNKLSGTEVPHLYDFLHRSGSHHFDPASPADFSVHNPHGNNDSFIGIIDRIKDQRLQRRVPVSLRRRNLADNGLQNLIHMLPCLCGNLRSILRLNPDNVLNLVNHSLRIRAGQVNFIDNRDNFQIIIQCQIDITQCLRLHSLRGVYHQHCAVAGRQAAGNFIIKINMSGSIYHIQNILLSVLRIIDNPACLRLNGNAALPLQLHIIENLALHFPACQQPRHLYNPVRQRGFSVVNMGYDTEISDFALIYL